jgi:hypothetical protein
VLAEALAAAILALALPEIVLAEAAGAALLAVELQPVGSGEFAAARQLRALRALVLRPVVLGTLGGRHGSPVLLGS